MVCKPIIELLKVVLLFVAVNGILGCANDSGGINWSALEKAEADRLERFKQMTLSEMPIEAVYPDQGLRELARAAKSGQIDRVEYLVREGQSVDATGTYGVGALWWPLTKNMYWNDRERELEGFKKLLDLGADPNRVFDGTSVIHFAASLGEIEFLKVLFQYGADPNLRAGPYQETPLFAALRANQNSAIEVMDLLLSEGEDIDAQIFAKDPKKSHFNGDTVLMRSVPRLQYEVALHLLRQGADFRIEDDSGDTLLDILRRQKERLPDHNEDKGLESVIDWLSSRGVHLPK